MLALRDAPYRQRRSAQGQLIQVKASQAKVSLLNLGSRDGIKEPGGLDRTDHKAPI
jgi:hypothetical protein